MQIDQEFLAQLAANIWRTGAQRRKFKLWLAELTKPLKAIDRKLIKQEDSFIKSIRSGALDAETHAESLAKIEEIRKDLKPWLEQMLAWCNGEEISLEEKKEEETEAVKEEVAK